MDRYFLANVATSAPTLPAGAVKGYPQDGNPGLGKLPTIPGAYAFWQLFAEMLNLVTTAGETPDSANLTQVAAAVQSIANTAAATAAAAAQAAAISAAATDATTKANAAHAAAVTEAVNDVNGEFTGTNIVFTAASGHQYWPNGSGGQRLDQWMEISLTAPANTIQTFAYPIAYSVQPNRPRVQIENTTASSPSANNFVGATLISHDAAHFTVAIGAVNAGGPDVVLLVDVRGKA